MTHLMPAGGSGAGLLVGSVDRCAGPAGTRAQSFQRDIALGALRQPSGPAHRPPEPPSRARSRTAGVQHAAGKRGEEGMTEEFGKTEQGMAEELGETEPGKTELGMSGWSEVTEKSEGTERIGMLEKAGNGRQARSGGAARWLAVGMCMLQLLAGLTHGQAKRSRQDGLNAVISSSTAGEGNLHMTLFGRTFLWDNQAAQKIPPLLPHGEINYGVTDWLDATAGLNALSYVLQPGAAYLRVKMTTPDNKIIRFLGVGQTLELRRNLMSFFPSNGYRVKTEGFGPEGFILGNGAAMTSFKFMTALDVELIRISSYLPFKLYGNLGWEGELDSWINRDNAERSKTSRLKIAGQDFSKMPMGMGVELKTYASDFFAELEAEPFARHVFRKIGADLKGEDAGEWMRFHVVGKVFDVHYLEMPIYVNAGAKLKYGNGLQLQAGFSWLLSLDEGPQLGPCDSERNPCRQGATDGYSPFYPQWKLFGLMRYPLRFTQPSSELYRSFLLKRYQDKRKRVDLDATLRAPAADAEELDANERRKRLEERRKEADGKAVDLN